MKLIKSHTFRGKRYFVKWKKFPVKRLSAKYDAVTYGNCDAPDTKNKTITIDPTSNEKELLETLIDEGLHACHWDLDNDSVQVTAIDIASIILRVGFTLKESARDILFQNEEAR